MKQLLNWRQWVLYALFAGCFIGFVMLGDESDNTMQEFISLRVYAVALMLACGWPLCRLTKKWGKEEKV